MPIEQTSNRMGEAIWIESGSGREVGIDDGIVVGIDDGAVGIEDRTVTDAPFSSSSISTGLGEILRCRLAFLLDFEVEVVFVVVGSSRLTLSKVAAKYIFWWESIVTNDISQG